MNSQINKIVSEFGNDRQRILDIAHKVHKLYGHITEEMVKIIAKELNMSFVEANQTISFYHFFKNKEKAKYNIYLNNGIVSKMYGREKVARSFENATKTKFNSISKDGLFGLYETADIGMADQEPAAIINGVVFPKITTFRVREIIKELRNGKCVSDLINSFGDGHNQDSLIKSMVANNLNRRGRVIFSGFDCVESLKKALEMPKEDIIETVIDSNIRGRGGAGFPTGIKWKYCSQYDNKNKYVICNADEGEPGTFKDRVILTEEPLRVIIGMVIAAYAVDASEGIIYLRKEYEYLLEYLNSVLEDARKKNILGNDILGKKGFNYDIRIQQGGGSYVCGAATALLESCEGKRGEPRIKPPYSIQCGYKASPTVVNNVETLASIPKIIDEGGEWYRAMGTKQSSGTKLISISGDVLYPGVFEVNWGTTIKDLLEMAGAHDTKAVQVGGPSGVLISKNHFSRRIAYEDLSTGGAFIVFNKSRNILNIVMEFTEFFIEESCGACGPCRNLTVILRDKLSKIINGFGVENDLEEMKHWGEQMKKVNRCGLGQSAANPILSSLENFYSEYEAVIQKGKEYDTIFDLDKAIIQGAKSVSRFPSV